MLADIIVIAILVVIVALVIRTIIKSKKAGQKPAVWNGLQPLQGLSLIHGMMCMKHRMGHFMERTHLPLKPASAGIGNDRRMYVERSNRAKRGNRWQAKGQRMQDYKAETYFT